MGGLDRCEATIMPQIVRDGNDHHFQIMVSVKKRDGGRPKSS